jgi:hypothetical protein
MHVLLLEKSIFFLLYDSVTEIWLGGKFVCILNYKLIL